MFCYIRTGLNYLFDMCDCRQALTKEAQVSLINVVHQMITDGNLKFAQLLRDALVVKVGKGWSVMWQVMN